MSLLTAQQAAELLNVPASWIYAETRAERIPFIPLGRYRRYDAAALEQWWRDRARGPWRDRGAAAEQARNGRGAA